jgi:phage terminase small subunit
MKKLSRAEIKAGFDSIPIDTILLGSASTKQTKLTHKQREFAREVALGETKTGAYRKAYKSKAKGKTQSVEAQRLIKNPSISLQIEAFKVAIEAQKYTTPAHLRALAIHKITEKALDPDVPPAQQLKALELLGKMTEVALFTERREVIQTQSSGDMRDKLMESIRQAISNSKAIDIEAHQADDLLAELVGTKDDTELLSYSDQDNSDSDSLLDELNQVYEVSIDTEQDGRGSAIDNPPTPHTPEPLFSGKPDEPNLHSIPHIGSPSKGDLTHVKLKNLTESDTYESSSINPNIGTPPVSVSNEKG